MAATNNTNTEDISVLKLAENNTTDKLLTRIEELVKSKGPLLPQRFQKVGPDVDSQPTYRVMQWNILAQALSLGPDNFIKCPIDSLEWNFRRLRIVQAILEVDPDVLCMQEVDHFDFLSEVLGSLGYKGSFFPKVDSPCLYAKNSNGPDGLAIFYKKGKFEEVQQHNFVLQADGIPCNQVCMTLTLKPKVAEGKEFTVATTHLKAKTGFGELRHKQGSYMLEYLREKLPSKTLIICGDFNADPTEPVYADCRNSKLGLKSAYAPLAEDGSQEPPYTTWKIRGGNKPGTEEEVSRTIDYIWYTQSSVQVSALRRFPTGEDMGPGRLPSFAYPSDHLSLAADFVLL